MNTQNKLLPDEKEFFTLVGQAAYMNPFSDKRNEFESMIADVQPHEARSTRVPKVLYNVSKRIQKLETEGRATLACYTGEDRNILLRTFLFELFYRYKDKFDQLIIDQILSGDTPLKIPFYNEAIAVMQQRGFTEDEFKHYFALGFQIRRAFYFIDRSLIGTSPSMKDMRLNLWNNVFTHNFDFYNRYLYNQMEDFSTLILGETGTGKGTAALAIGRSGYIPLERKKKAFMESFTRSFVSLNLSQFPETLVESELFGHKKGAFTGAIEEYKGVFDRCSPHGSIFLDEIGEIPPHIQIKLLQVLQERTFCPVGSKQISRFNGRVIAATNRHFDDIRKGLFRDDFYYRLCSDVIMVPPLRQRIAEDPQELDHLLSFTITRMVGSASPELLETVKKVIDQHLGKDYQWPGNVRELEQCVKRVLLKGTYTGDMVNTAMNLEADLNKGISAGNINAQNLITGYCYLLYQRFNTFEEVARRTGLDRRTAKKYIQAWQRQNNIPDSDSPDDEDD